MEHVHAALLIVGGLLVVGYLVLARMKSRHVELLPPVQAFAAMALFVFAAAIVFKGPLRMFHGPPLLVFVLAAASYGALGTGACLVLPEKAPKPAQAILGIVSVVAGVLLLLLQLRVIKPI